MKQHLSGLSMRTGHFTGKGQKPYLFIQREQRHLLSRNDKKFERSLQVSASIPSDVHHQDGIFSIFFIRINFSSPFKNHHCLPHVFCGVETEMDCVRRVAGALSGCPLPVDVLRSAQRVSLMLSPFVIRVCRRSSPWQLEGSLKQLNES
jgi:hypothetical protein